MKRTVTAILIAVVAIASIAGVGIAYAQGANPQGFGPGYGYGMMGTNGTAPGQYMGYGMHGTAAGTGTGILHDGMIAAFAEALDIDAADLEARLAAGETMYDIAAAEGLSVEEFRTLMLDARSAALDQAVLDGTLTAEQAEWMKTHGNGMMGGYGYGRGAGQGQYANGSCPFHSTTQP